MAAKKTYTAAEIDAIVEELESLRLGKTGFEARLQTSAEDISRLSGELSRCNGERETQGIQIGNLRSQCKEMEDVINRQSDMIAKGCPAPVDPVFEALAREKVMAGMHRKDAEECAKRQIAHDAEIEREKAKSTPAAVAAGDGETAKA